MIGFECTSSVDDVDATAAAIVAHGGAITLPTTVGTLIQFHDTEVNVVCAMKYDANVR